MGPFRVICQRWYRCCFCILIGGLSILICFPTQARAQKPNLQFWRFVLVQQIVSQYAQTFIDFPPMQKGASFNLEQLKEEPQKKITANQSQ